MQDKTKAPPRFVPTLTEVVQEAGTESVAGASGRQFAPWANRVAISLPPVAPLAASRPTIPQAPAVQTDGAPEPSLTAASAMAFSAAAAAAASSAGAAVPPSDAARAVLNTDFEELLVHRVMQRVDVSLDMRLAGAIATVVQEQTRSVVPRLREEIEAVVRQAVYEAVADELAAGVSRPVL